MCVIYYCPICNLRPISIKVFCSEALIHGPYKGCKPKDTKRVLDGTREQGFIPCRDCEYAIKRADSNGSRPEGRQIFSTSEKLTVSTLQEMQAGRVSTNRASQQHPGAVLPQAERTSPAPSSNKTVFLPSDTQILTGKQNMKELCIDASRHEIRQSSPVHFSLQKGSPTWWRTR